MSALWVESGKGVGLIALKDPKGEWTASATRGGKVHLRRAYKESASKSCVDYLQLSDLDETIRRLEAVRELAKAHFGQWPSKDVELT